MNPEVKITPELRKAVAELNLFLEKDEVAIFILPALISFGFWDSESLELFEPALKAQFEPQSVSDFMKLINEVVKQTDNPGTILLNRLLIA
jgi:hypothetical protein